MEVSVDREMRWYCGSFGRHIVIYSRAANETFQLREAIENLYVSHQFVNDIFLATGSNRDLGEAVREFSALTVPYNSGQK